MPETEPDERRRDFAISVRDLVAFLCRSGDVGGEGGFTGSSRAVEGTRGHQRIQKIRGADYDLEVPIEAKIERGAVRLRLRGRIDCLKRGGNPPVIEEIKTVRSWPPREDPLHWAQLKVYAHLVCEREKYEAIEGRLTYLQLDSNLEQPFSRAFTSSELASFYAGLVAEYLPWLEKEAELLGARDASLRDLSFPFSFRPGQRQLSVAVYRAITREGRLFAEAPTGIGKTISVLFPAIKAMGEQRIEKIFYLTAKTIGRTVAEKALRDLRASGLWLRGLTLSSKEKWCVRDDGTPCDPRTCPRAIGHYDRLKPALWEGLSEQTLDREKIGELASRHQVCPFEFSLDLALWADVLICDYNYVFDPSAYLRRFFEQEKNGYAFLIDEAQHLVDRSREMFSTQIDEPSLREVERAIDSLPDCRRALGRVRRRMRDLIKRECHDGEGQVVRLEAPAKVLEAVKDFLAAAEAWLVRNEPSSFRELLLGAYFEIFRFNRIGESFDSSYRAILATDPSSIRLFCLDASAQIRARLDQGKAAIFFSATLSPLDFFCRSLGGEAGDPRLQLASPFDPANLKIMVADRIGTDFKQREGSYDEVAKAIGAFASAKHGNYLVYFPSYKYLNEVSPRIAALRPNVDLRVQTPRLGETEREAFLSAFRADHDRTLIGCAIMGGIFGEGIDLIGDRLVGAVVVGVGLPQISFERDLLRDYFDERDQAGFEFAYLFPGMNKVLQAVGRVIRSESDRGAVLLIDRRFGEGRYRRLFPRQWDVSTIRNESSLSDGLRSFWRG